MKRNLCFFLLISAVFLYVSCPQNEAELFQITPAVGHEFGFFGGYVTIKNPPGNTKLYYTVSGGDPVANGILNEEKPIRITRDTTIKVVTKINDMVDSHVIDLPYAVFSNKLTDFALSMRIGWNLGKTMSELEDTSNAEIQTMLSGVKNYGFNLARIPLTWNDVDGEAEGLNKAFNIAQSVVSRTSTRIFIMITFTLDQASFNGYDDNQIISRFNSAWTKIAAKFNTINLTDEQNGFIVFEAFSELDRNDPVIPEQQGIMNQLNQNFVNTVRQSAGKNKTRFLVLPVTNFSLISGFVLPNDNLQAVAPSDDQNKLLVSVRFFEPQGFTTLGTQNKWGSKAVSAADNESYIKDQFDLLRNKFTEQNIPVILSEYGAVHQIGFEDYRRYYMEYVTKYAVDSGLIPVYWDNGDFHDNTAEEGDNSAYKFGLLNRATGAPDNSVPAHKHNEVFTAIMQAVDGDYHINDISPP